MKQAVAIQAGVQPAADKSGLLTEKIGDIVANLL
jgi:hypothetical protein